MSIELYISSDVLLVNDDIRINLTYKNKDEEVNISFNIGTGIFIEGFYSTTKTKNAGYSLLCWILKKIKNYYKFSDNTIVSLLAMGSKQGVNRSGLFLYYYNMGFNFEEDVNISLLNETKKMSDDQLQKYVNREMYSLLTEGELYMSAPIKNIIEKCTNSTKVIGCIGEKMPIKSIKIGSNSSQQIYTQPDTLPDNIIEFLSC